MTARLRRIRMSGLPDPNGLNETYSRDTAFTIGFRSLGRISRRLAEVPASAAQPVITCRHPSCSLTAGPTSKGHGPLNPLILTPVAARQDYLHPASNPALHTDRELPRPHLNCGLLLF